MINEEEEEAYDAETDSEAAVVGEKRNSDSDKSAAGMESRPKRIPKKRDFTHSRTPIGTRPALPRALHDIAPFVTAHSRAFALVVAMCLV